MKIHARQHVPAFVDLDTRNSADVESVQELLAVPWIARFAELFPVKTFHQWSLAGRGTSQQTLMAEIDRGDYFWVVAFLTSDEPIDLPEWKMTETARLHLERWNRGEIGEAYSTPDRSAPQSDG